MKTIFSRKTLLPLLLVLVVLLPLYFYTLQTIPNGSENYFMIDVGETQNVLNQWGTLHATGYPLFVMVGNVLVAVMKLLGVNPATAPGAASLIYGLIALALIYALGVCLTAGDEAQSSRWKWWLAAGMTILFGLTRTTWVHNSIAEVYSFGLMLLALLLLIALWPGKVRGRVFWLALVGGIGVFHHRGLIMAAPALVYAAWPDIKAAIWPQSKTQSRTSVILHAVGYFAVILLIGLIGFLPYIYLPIRANAGATWVYGQPGNWNGFWDQFLGREADHFIALPNSVNALAANFNLVTTVIITDVTLPGIILGLLGLVLALRNPARRRAAITLILSGAAAYLFHVLVYTDILSALILPANLSLAFGWLFLAEWLVNLRLATPVIRYSFVALVAIIFAAFLITQNLPFIHDLSSNTTGLETIALAKEAPAGSTLMLDWGPRYYAVGFAKGVLNQLPDITLVDDKADFKRITGELVTADFTFYNRPVSWWEQQLGKSVYISAAAPHLVDIATQPQQAASVSGTGIQVESQTLDCTPDALNLEIGWQALSPPERDLSVFVHLLDANGAVIAQGDESSPVYGWRPVTSWQVGEIVPDVYPLPRLPNAALIRYGLYYQDSSGAFVNETSYDVPVKCDG